MSRLRIPLGLPISIAMLLVLGFIAGPVVRSRFTEEQRAANVFLEAIPFLLIFVAIILAFITLIVLAARSLNGRVSQLVYQRIERVVIAGIVLGIIGMFQPWWFVAYRYGFSVLLVSTLAFILWSHIQPKGKQRQEELTSVSISES